MGNLLQRLYEATESQYYGIVSQLCLIALLQFTYGTRFVFQDCVTNILNDL